MTNEQRTKLFIDLTKDIHDHLVKEEYTDEFLDFVSGRVSLMILDKYDLVQKEKPNEDPRCFSCGNIMIEVYDTVAHSYTGHLWRCDNCMRNPDMVLSIG